MLIAEDLTIMQEARRAPAGRSQRRPGLGLVFLAALGFFGCATLVGDAGQRPLWLDEGLAEYFEGPEGSQGLNPEHIARLPDDLKSGWRPDLARLESLATVREMAPRDYREAWAWVHYLLNDPAPCKTALL